MKLFGEKTIIEYNKLIAIFLDYEYHKFPEELPGWRKSKEYLMSNDEYYLCRSHRGLDFHHNWNHLMLAINKIESLKIDWFENFDNKKELHTFRVCIDGNNSYIKQNIIPNYYDGDNNFLSLYDERGFYTKIESTYLAVVEFIHWYNMNNKIQNS